MSNQFVFAKFVVFLFFIVSCGKVNDDFPPPATPNDADAKNKASVSLATPEEAFFRHAFQQMLLRIDSVAASLEKKFYLNLVFEPGQITRKDSPFFAQLLCKDDVALKASRFSMTERDEIMRFVQGEFDRLGLAVSVVSKGRSQLNAPTLLITSGIEQLGCEKKKSFGLAIFDEKNLHPNDVGFLFDANLFSTRQAANAILHLFGGMSGLKQTMNSSDIMYFDPGTAEVHFTKGRMIGTSDEQDGEAKLQEKFIVQNPSQAPGKSTDASLTLFVNVPERLQKTPHLKTIEAFAKLLAGWKEAEVPTGLVDVAKVVAELKAKFGESVKLEYLDRVVLISVLLQNAVLSDRSINGLPTNEKIAQAVRKMAALVQSQTFTSLAALAAAAGFPSVGAAVAALQAAGLVLLAIIPELKALIVSETPYIAQILGLDQLANLSELIKLMHSHAELIDLNLLGDTKASTLTFLKLAYIQAYILMVQRSALQP